MATSNSYTFNLNKLQIITEALDIVNLLPSNGNIPQDMFNKASNSLNMLIKYWEARQIKLWKRKEATLFPQLNQASYQLGSVSGADHVTGSYVNTFTSSSTASGVNQIVVTSTTGLTNGMNIGLELDSELMQWGTISSINTGTKTITVSFTTSTTAASGQAVYAYSSLINRPLRVLRGTYMDVKAGNIEVTMQKLSYDEYFNLPKKNIPGPPTNFYYDRVLDNSLPYTGTFYIYPAPNVTSKIINFTYLDSLQDMLNNTDSADFPQEWVYPIVINLSAMLAMRYGKMQEYPTIKAEADQALAVAENFDSDDEEMHISIDWTQLGRRMF